MSDGLSSSHDEMITQTGILTAKVGRVIVFSHSLQSAAPGFQEYEVAAVIDVETTGLDVTRDDVVELAIALFAYDPDTGRIVAILDAYSGLRDPGKPIPRKATAVHGICDNDVCGKRLDDVRVLDLLRKANFLVAHNAAFDRPFVERLYPQAKGKFWACSMSGIPWNDMGFPSRGLQNLLRYHGIVAERAHRGEADVRATLTLLARKDSAGRYYFRYLLDRLKRQNLKGTGHRDTDTRRMV